MDGLEFISRIRRAGKKPSMVWVMMCEEPQPKFWRWSDFSSVEIYVKPDQRSARLDWRPLVGCDVTIVADDNCSALRAVVERLVTLVRSMTVSTVTALRNGDPGHIFVRGSGWRSI